MNCSMCEGSVEEHARQREQMCKAQRYLKYAGTESPGAWNRVIEQSGRP